MANSFNTSQTTITTVNSPTTVFTASASTTLVKSIRVMHGSSTSSATLGITKSGGSRTDMNTVTLSANVMGDLITDVLPLAAGDSLTVESTHQPTYVWVSYVENATAVNGQSIDVLNDVDTTTVAPTPGQALVWDGSQWEPGTVASGSTAINDLTDVISTSPSAGDVLQYSQGLGKWVESQELAELIALIKSGSTKLLTAEATNLDTTEGFVKLEATAATLKVNNTGVEINETSPGDIEFVVATDSTGSTAYTALHVDGSTTASLADILIKPGSLLKFEDGTYNLWLRRPTTLPGNLVVFLPNKNGTLATEDAIPVNVTDLIDVTSAGSGAIITTAERNKLAGIADGAEVNAVDSVNTQTGAVVLDADDISDATTTKKFTTAADISKLAGIETGADVTDETNVKAALDGMTLSATTVLGGDRILIQDASASYEQKYVLYDNFVLKQYVTDELVSSQNITFQAGVSVASNKIVDVMGDALADPSNANSKKMLGFHTGSGVVVLKGMVDASNTIQGATAGAPLWIGASGSFSATAPTTATYYSRVVGYYIGTLVGGEVMCYFDPSKDWVQID